MDFTIYLYCQIFISFFLQILHNENIFCKTNYKFTAVNNTKINYCMYLLVWILIRICVPRLDKSINSYGVISQTNFLKDFCLQMLT